MTSTDFINRISRAFHKLFRQDAELFTLGEGGINKQTITFRLGLYLVGEFPNHNVDCEYNRIWDEKKRCLRFGINWMKPDVIVHLRQSSKANLFCVEAKKIIDWKLDEPIPRDISQKLKALTHLEEQYRYSLGLAWRVAPSGDAKDHHASWFVGGTHVLTTQLASFEDSLNCKLAEFGVSVLQP